MSLPTRDLLEALESAGKFGRPRVRRVRHELRLDRGRMFDAIRRRYASPLHAMTDEDIEKGLRRLEETLGDEQVITWPICKDIITVQRV